jgi:hypothetical protein
MERAESGKQAVERLLSEHGIPGRPGPESAPVLHRAWERMFPPSRELTAVTLFEPGGRRPVRAGGTGGDPAMSNWAGVTVRRPGDSPLQVVSAEFTLPALPPANTVAGPQLGFWIGLMNGPLDEIVQAGIGWPLMGGLMPFTQFFPDQADSVSVNRQDGTPFDPPISDGYTKCDGTKVPPDTINLLVTGPGAWGPGSIDIGFAFILDIDTGQVALGPVGSPQDASDESDVGYWAGCIVEHTAHGDLPDFGTFAFTNFVAGDVSQVVDLSGADTWEINTGTTGNDLTSTTITSGSTGTVQWLAAE